MSDRRITSFAIGNLELLFSPVGLPVVDKGATAPTTSIALLGDAGAGKTTLAVALALGIATELDGIALYLTTELAPTELKYKVSLLGGSSSVFSWKHRGDAHAGDLVGQHVALLDEATEGQPIRRRSLEAAWQLVESSESVPPIRCVVIDAFPLPDMSNGKVRDEVVILIQALESRGVSVVIVQETVNATDFVPFVADIVFQLRFDEDPDTGERIRKLACPKSRYARSLVGPHDTGVDGEVIAVWPDPMFTGRDIADAPAVFVPVHAEGECVVFDAGGFVISKYQDEGWLLELLRGTPGLRPVWVQCGPMTHVVAGAHELLVPTNEGAYSLAWAIANVQRASGANLVIIQNLNSLVRRKRFRAPIEHVIEALRRGGSIACVHGSAADVAEVTGFSDLEADGRWNNSREMQRRAHQPVAAWLGARFWPFKRTHALRSERHRTTADAISQLGAGRSARDVRADIDAFSLDTDPTSAESRLHASVIVNLLGTDVSSRLQYGSDKTIGAAAWANTLLGRDWHAAMAIVDAQKRGELGEELRALWAALTAVHARSAPALARAREALGELPALLDLVVRALARESRWDDVDAAIAVVDKREHGIVRFADWVRADARLDGPDRSDWEDAERRYRSLLEASKLPGGYRAPLVHSLGVAARRLGREDEAQRCWRHAVELDPQHELAAKLLAE